METPAQTAARFGVKPDELADLLEIPKFAEALAAAQADSGLSIVGLILSHNLPTLPGARITEDAVSSLDVNRMRAEAVGNRLRRERLEDVGRRGDGSARPPERVEGTGMALGRMQKAEKRVKKLYEALERVDTLLLDTTNTGMPAVTNVNAARKVVKEAMR